MATSETHVPISARLPSDLVEAIERTRQEDVRTRTDQIEYLLRRGLAGRERLAELERMSAPPSLRPAGMSAEARQHLIEHARLGGMPAPTFEDPT